MDFALELFDDFFNRQINHPPPLLKNIPEKNEQATKQHFIKQKRFWCSHPSLPKKNDMI